MGNVLEWEIAKVLESVWEGVKWTSWRRVESSANSSISETVKVSSEMKIPIWGGRLKACNYTFFKRWKVVERGNRMIKGIGNTQGSIQKRINCLCLKIMSWKEGRKENLERFLSGATMRRVRYNSVGYLHSHFTQQNWVTLWNAPKAKPPYFFPVETVFQFIKWGLTAAWPLQRNWFCSLSISIATPLGIFKMER